MLVAELLGKAGGFALGTYYPNDLDAEYDLWKFQVHAPSEHTFGGRQVDLEIQLVHRLRGSAVESEAANETAVVSLGFFSSLSPSPLLDALCQGGLPDKEGAATVVNKRSPEYVDFSGAFKPGIGIGTASEAEDGKSKAVSGQDGADMADASANVTLTYLGHQATFVQYTGSFTTPPCTSGVQWFVRSAPLPIHVETLTAFQEVIKSSVGLEQADHWGNDRELQPSCGVQLTTWMAESAFQFPAPEEDESNEAAFRRTEVESGQNDQAFAEALGATGDARSVESQVRVDYERCATQLTRTRAALQQGERQMESECEGVKVAESRYNQTRTLQASALLRTQQALCKSSTEVLAALQKQLSAQSENCKTLQRRAGE